MHTNNNNITLLLLALLQPKFLQQPLLRHLKPLQLVSIFVFFVVAKSEAAINVTVNCAVQYLCVSISSMSVALSYIIIMANLSTKILSVFVLGLAGGLEIMQPVIKRIYTILRSTYLNYTHLRLMREFQSQIILFPCIQIICSFVTNSHISPFSLSAEGITASVGVDCNFECELQHLQMSGAPTWG